MFFQRWNVFLNEEKDNIQISKTKPTCSVRPHFDFLFAVRSWCIQVNVRRVSGKTNTIYDYEHICFEES